MVYYRRDPGDCMHRLESAFLISCEFHHTRSPQLPQSVHWYLNSRYSAWGRKRQNWKHHFSAKKDPLSSSVLWFHIHNRPGISKKDHLPVTQKRVPKAYFSTGENLAQHLLSVVPHPACGCPVKQMLVRTAVTIGTQSATHTKCDANNKQLSWAVLKNFYWT